MRDRKLRIIIPDSLTELVSSEMLSQLHAALLSTTNWCLSDAPGPQIVLAKGRVRRGVVALQEMERTRGACCRKYIVVPGFNLLATVPYDMCRPNPSFLCEYDYDGL